jgi:hypothetical protein
MTLLQHYEHHRSVRVTFIIKEIVSRNFGVPFYFIK